MYVTREKSPIARGSLRGLMTNVLDYDIILRKVKHQLNYYEKDKNTLIFKVLVK